MSHFSVCVIVPDDGVVNNIHANNLEDHLIPVLAPFDEQTEEEKYREFEDRTEEAKADFENDTMRVVRFPDGSIHSIYDDAFNKFFFVEEDKIYAFGPNRDRKSKLQTEESKALELVTDYPVKSWYPSFEAYCDEHRGFVKASDGRWGYTCNPNAKWDWWQIGGRFPNRFLVSAGLQDCIPSAKDDDGESAIPPEGYQYADAARKKDICWDVMRKIAVDTVEKRYQKCVRAFETKDITDFGPLCRILDEGISAWGEMLYLKGETLDEYKARKGATDLDRYMCHTYAFIDRNGDWTGSGDMGWFGISSNDKDERAWNDEIQKLMNEAKDDDCRTAQFKLYDLTDGRIVSTAIVDTMGNGHGALTGFLKAYAVDALICGGIGAGARLALEEAGIRLYPGAAGSADEAVHAFLAGTLQYQPDLVCSHHRDAPPRVCGSHTCSAACYHERQEKACHEPN